MASNDPGQRNRIATTGAHTMWGGVADRKARLRNAHNNSPAGENWHARRLFGADVDLEKLTDKQWAQVRMARLSYLKAISLKAVEAKRRNAPRRTIARLRDKADLLEARMKAEQEQRAAGDA